MFSFCYFSCSVGVIWYGASVTCVCMDDNIRELMVTEPCRPSSSSVTECYCTLGTLHGPDARLYQLLYQGLVISSAASDATVASGERSTNS